MGVSAALLSCSLSMTAAAVQAATQGSTNESKTVDLTFRNDAVHRRVLESRDGMAIAEDDMIVGYANQFFGSDRTVRGLGNTVYGRTWPNGIVPYQFAADLSAASEAKVRSAVAHWNANSSILLVERTATNASEYPNYLSFISATQCASWVGFQGTGGQDVYVGDNCTTGSMIHEIGHGLGLLHEHTRPDRDAYVSIDWGNIIEDKEHNFDILSDGAVMLGEYDYGSIMHYGTHFFSSSSAPTISAILPTSATIGQRIATSDGDRAAIGTLYETDLSISISGATQVAEGDSMDMVLTIANTADNGANSLSVTLPVYADTNLLEYGSSLWDCSQAATGISIVCTSELLGAGQSSQISLSVNASAGVDEMTMVPVLDSRTQDSAGSNNSDSHTVAVLADDQGGGSTSPVVTPDPQPPVSQPEPPAVADSGSDSEPVVIDSGSDSEPVVVVTTPQTEPNTAAALSASGGGAGSMGTGLAVLLLLGVRRGRQAIRNNRLH